MRLLLLVFILTIFGCSNIPFLNQKRDLASDDSIEHVVVIGIAGLSGSQLKAAKTPNLDKMILEGAHTLHMKNILPSTSIPNWFSLFSGVDEEHGIEGVAGNSDAFPWLPTIFKVYKEQKYNFKVAAFYNWKEIKELIERGFLDASVHNESAKKLTKKATKFFKEHHPGLTFIQYQDVLKVGLKDKFGSEKYNKKIQEIDRLIGDILKVVEKSEISNKTMVIVTSNHGGAGTEIGGNGPSDTDLPFIVKGPNIKKNYSLVDPINIFDIAPTICHAVGKGAPQIWLGTRIKEMFKEQLPDIDPYRPVIDIKFKKNSAAINWGGNRGYLFNNLNFFRFDLDKGKIDRGPNSSWNFIGLNKFREGPSNIDAAFRGEVYREDGRKAYFFKGSYYLRYDLDTEKVDRGFPMRINMLNWKGLHRFKGGGRHLDAVFNMGNGKAYFFKGDQYIKFDLLKDYADKGYPKMIKKDWPGLKKFRGGAKNIDSAINWGNGKIFFFKGEEYIRFDLRNRTTDPGYPKILD